MIFFFENVRDYFRISSQDSLKNLFEICSETFSEKSSLIRSGVSSRSPPEIHSLIALGIPFEISTAIFTETSSGLHPQNLSGVPVGFSV